MRQYRLNDLPARAGRRVTDTVYRLQGTGRARNASVAVAGAASVLLSGGAATGAVLASNAPQQAVSIAHHAGATDTKKKTEVTGSVKRGTSKPKAAAGPTSLAVAAKPAATTTSAADNVLPTATAGPQEYMPLTASQKANAETIVHQAMAKGMGARSAVIAVATSMQESRLQNIGYGDADSLGLFQQRPSMGWGTQDQLMTPSYAADSFLTALQHEQASNPGWAKQPLWSVAQSVQKSADPTAYAKWESQAADLVKQAVATPAKTATTIVHKAADHQHTSGGHDNHHRTDS